MVMSMEKKLVWKELTDDGLLKEPKECGPTYDIESLKDGSGFDSEEEAIIKLEQMKKDYNWNVSGNYVLVTIYSP